MVKVLVDTNVLIDYSKGYDSLLKFLLSFQEKGKISLFVNPVVIAEFLNDKVLVDRKNEKMAIKFLENFSVASLGKKHGLLCAELVRLKRIDFLADAFVAASCLEDEMSLATRNGRHFRKIKGLKVISNEEGLKF